MKDKRINLAAGRLGIASPDRQAHAARSAVNSTYGVSRLGIISVEDIEAPDSPSQPLPPSAPIREEESAEQAPPPREEELDADAQCPSDEPICRPSPRFRRPPFLIVAACATAALVAVGWWALRPSSGKSAMPQSAVAGGVEAAARIHPATQVSPEMQTAEQPEPVVIVKMAEPKPARPEPIVVALPQQQSQPAASSQRSPLTDVAPAKVAPETPPAVTRAPTPASRPSGGPAEPATSPPEHFAMPAASPTVAATSQPAPADPPQPAAKPKVRGFTTAAPGIEVSCIMRGPNGPAAVINRRTVSVGETVGEATVVRIDDFAVEFEQDGQLFQVSVFAPARQGDAVASPAASRMPDTAPAKEAKLTTKPAAMKKAEPSDDS